MTFSPLTTRVAPTAKYSSRQGKKIERLIIHHTAGGSNAGNEQELARNNARKASSTYLLRTDNQLIGMVPEEYRPWTTGSFSADGTSVTVETVNTGGAPKWPVGDKQVEKLAQLAADLSQRYGWGSLTRKRVMAHYEFMATACAGPTLNAKLDWIVARANAIRSGKDSVVPPANPGGSKVIGQYRVSTKSAPLNGRAGPGTNYKITMTAAKGYVLNITEIKSGWARSTGGHWYSMSYLTQVNNSSGTTSGGNTLKRGSKGGSVRKLQEGLRAVFPLYASKVAADGLGTYGVQTESAVREFQRRSGLTADGIVGAQTWAALGRYNIRP